MQPDASDTHKHTHSVRTDATGPDLATSFPWGNTRRHQLSGAPLLCFPVLSSCLLPSPNCSLSHPLVILYFHSFLPSSCILLLQYSFTSQLLSHKLCFPCHFIFPLFLTVISLLWEMSCLCVICRWARVSQSSSLWWVQQWDCIAADWIAELWSELWRTLPAAYTHQRHTHKHQHSHRLRPSTRSHSLGLRGRGEHGQSWHELFVCVCACVGQCAKVYICSPWTCLSSSLPCESSWPFTTI